MLLDNFLKLSKQDTLLLIFLISFSFLVRIPIILILGDVTLENEWGRLLHNLINYKTLSLESFGSFLLPNLQMPPLYAYYLYVFSFFKLGDQNFIILILFSQILLASVSVVVFYKINKRFFSQKVSFYSSLLFSLFPIYLYACAQISSASLTIFLSVLFYYYFFKITDNNKFIYILIFAFIGGLLILVRREFIAIIILSNLYLFFYFKVSFKKIFLTILITIITTSPYLVRNYLIFDKIILHASFGYNLWQGNNPKSKVEGSEIRENNLQNQINKIPKDKFYRINEDKIFTDEAINNIKNNPKKYLILYFKKVAAYFFIDLESSLPNYYNPFHYIPNLLLGITSLVGIFLSGKKSYRLNYLILILIFYILVFPIFAIQPRYKLYIIPFQIIFSTIFAVYILRKFFYRRS